MKFRNWYLFFFLTVFAPLASASFYDERPSVLDVEPLDSASSSDKDLQNWIHYSRGQVAFLAQTLIFFPDHEYYFLARDVEYVYDIARVLLKDHPQLLKRIHLVPISTDLSDEPEKKIYLGQQGVTKENLEGRAALFIDSCCFGTVPARISDAFRSRDIQIKGFLISNGSFPKSDMAYDMGLGQHIESLPHYTESASAFIKEKGGVLRVQAQISEDAEKRTALQIMSKIRFDYDTPEARAKFSRLLKFMQQVFAYFSEEDPGSKADEKKALKAIRILTAEYKIPIRSLLTDIVALKERNNGFGPKFVNGFGIPFENKTENEKMVRFFKANPTIKKTLDDVEVFNRMLHWDKFIDVVSDLEENYYEGRAISKAEFNRQRNELALLAESDLDQLLKSTPNSLAMSDVSYNFLIQKWIQVLRDNKFHKLAKKVSREYKQHFCGPLFH